MNYVYEYVHKNKFLGLMYLQKQVKFYNPSSLKIVKLCANVCSRQEKVFVIYLNYLKAHITFSYLRNT